jgi:hypothetical protein
MLTVISLFLALMSFGAEITPGDVPRIVNAVFESAVSDAPGRLHDVRLRKLWVSRDSYRRFSSLASMTERDVQNLRSPRAKSQLAEVADYHLCVSDASGRNPRCTIRDGAVAFEIVSIEATERAGEYRAEYRVRLAEEGALTPPWFGRQVLIRKQRGEWTAEGFGPVKAGS